MRTVTACHALLINRALFGKTSLIRQRSAGVVLLFSAFCVAAAVAATVHVLAALAS